MPHMRVVLLLILLSVIFAVHPHRNRRHKIPDMSSPYMYPLKYSVGWFDQKITHFNFKVNGTFPQKYLIDLTNWNRTNKGPILFYCGNEGPVEMFYNNSGWYNEYLSKDLGGMVLYMEHRYFGQSWPFKDEKTSFQKQNLVYLTTAEATMDYVVFLQWIKEKYCSDCPVVAFGGSYAGMLAAWMRMKYPHVVDMAHAASGPIYYFANRKNLDLNVFYQIVTKNYQMYSQNCPDVIREGFRRLINYYNDQAAPLASLSLYFNLCETLKIKEHIAYLINYINDAYSYMAMLNYPYPTNFLKKLPAWPANSSCQPISLVNKMSSDKDLFTAIRKSIEYYYNYDGTAKCNDIFGDSSSDEDMSGWDILACADQAMPMGMDGVKDMFYREDFDREEYDAYCRDTYGIQPDYNYTLQFFGGRTDKELLSYSRIMFTNGNLDPWSGASPISSLSADLPACYIEGGAHHLDLRPPNALDPYSVIVCRNQTSEYLKKWISQVKIEKLTDM